MFIVTLLMVGCEVGPDYVPPKLNLPKIENTKADREISEFLSGKRWWNVFNDSTLDKLEEIALKNNADLKQAIANIEEACAMAGVSISDLMPSVGLNGSVKDGITSKKTTFGALTKGMSNLDYIGTIGVSYEIDFFGKYLRANEAARANLLSSKAAREAVILAVTAEVAKTYFALRTVDAKLSIARRTLKSRQESYKVYKSRFENGYCTELDYLRIEAEMSSIKTMVLDLESTAEKIENALSVLIGTNPREMISRKTTRFSSLERLKVSSNVPKGLPSNLLARRPDVAQTEGQLIAANAAIGQAIAGHFPSFSLTGAYGFESRSLGSLFVPNATMSSFGFGISLPLLAGGKIASMTNVAKARYKKILAAYEKTIQTAFRETLDALVSSRKSREIVVSRTRQVNALKKSYAIAKIQKESGLIGMLDLLDVERGLLSAEMDLAGALQNQLNSVVDLCKALGGGWNVKKL
jgi:multidrug efflux system outer membrane protein